MIRTSVAPSVSAPPHRQADTSRPVLEGRGLVKRFGSTTVLHGVDVDLYPGECLAVLGPSGCGKSTLLNLCAGFLAADGGVLRCGDRVLDDAGKGVHIPIHHRRFAMVFQDFSLWPHLSVAENVAFGLRLDRVPAGERRQRVLEALRRVRMESYADRLPGRLSGGQQQRVAIARAIVVNPVVLLLDEPLSALDALLREELRDELSGLIAQLGMSTIFVTHDQSEALSLAHRVMVMNAGRVEQVDPPEALYARPRTDFVAGFIGSANVLTARRTSDGWSVAGTRVIGHVFPAAAELHGELIRFMLRREAVRIVMAGSDAANHAKWLVLKGTVRSCCYGGERYELVLVTEDGTTLRGFSETPIGVGRAAEAHLDRATAHVLEG